MMVHINIGSNLGDRDASLRRAADEIMRALPGTTHISRPYKSRAWGYESDKTYINIGLSVMLDEPREPLEILDILQSIERAIDSHPHRDATGAYIDRRIDIDIIAIDGIVADTPRLTLPHPRMHLREFVLIPMIQTAPGWIHPTLGLTPAQLAARLSCTSGRPTTASN